MIQKIGNEIRYFEKMMRNANAQYPRISPYRVFLNNTQRYLTPKQEEWLSRIINTLKYYRNKTIGKTLTEIFENDLNGLKQNRLGNCGESSALTMAALIANGNTDGRLVRLIFDGINRDLKTGKIINKRTFDTKHECVLVNLAENADSKNPKTYGKKLIVIDAWEGFCTNLNEAFKKYHDTFLAGNYKYIDKTNNTELSYKPWFYFYKQDEVFDKNTIVKFKKLFPELIISKTVSKISHHY